MFTLYVVYYSDFYKTASHKNYRWGKGDTDYGNKYICVDVIFIERIDVCCPAKQDWCFQNKLVAEARLHLRFYHDWMARTERNN